MWQEIAIIIIAIAVVGYTGYKVIVLFKKPISPCDKCDGCPLKEQVKGKSIDCKDLKKEE